MRGLLLACIAGGCLLLECCERANAQQPQPVPLETKRNERDGSAQVVSYTLAAIGTIIVMVLVCMPARRE